MHEAAESRYAGPIGRRRDSSSGVPCISALVGSLIVFAALLLSQLGLEDANLVLVVGKALCCRLEAMLAQPIRPHPPPALRDRDCDP